MIQEVRVRKDAKDDPTGAWLLREVRRAGSTKITEIRSSRVYRLEGISEQDAEYLKEELFSNSVDDICVVNEPLFVWAAYVVEVAPKPGVMNPEVASIMKAAELLGITGLTAACSSTEYAFYDEMGRDEVYRIIGRFCLNETVQRIVFEPPQTLRIEGESGPVEFIKLRSLGDEELAALAQERQLFLDLAEMRAIRSHCEEIGRDLTDAELETLAQTWSEHCKHKTFKAPLVIDGIPKAPLMERLSRTAERYNGSLVISAFRDNAGVFEFYDGFAIVVKGETHNSPSALDPRGGAGTGTGGVLRDVMGTGQGARVIASSDIFCLARWDLMPEHLPEGCLRPDYILRNLVAGVGEYGNQMGVPTVNGSLHFHPDWRAKPTVIVGADGITEARYAQKGVPQPGDRIIVIGGRTGRDGIHGATFSSGAMTERTATVSASAVQIGNPMEEKRMADALIKCRDEGLIRAITDCGAGGLSSAIGEMGAELGVRVELSVLPLKYSGLRPWEIWLSEAQERMVVAVAPENVAAVLAIAAAHNVEATEIGFFTGDRQLTVTHGAQGVLALSMEFLHNGMPQQVREGRRVLQHFPEPKIPEPCSADDWRDRWLRVLRHGNICSKELIVRRYDHGVQGMAALVPYSGVHHDGPNDAAILQPLADRPYGLVLSHGMHPILNRIDSYRGGLWAVAEALANLVAVGGNPREAVLIDNFIWPFPDAEELGALDAGMEACVDAMEAFEIPVISGKDSLSSTYRGKDGLVIKIPRVLCISARGRIPDIAKTVSADFKAVGSRIVLVGDPDAGTLGGSVYYDTFGAVGNQVPRVPLEELPARFDAVHALIRDGYVHAAHDISEGGVAVALAEMCFGGDVGAEIDAGGLGEGRSDFLLFAEAAGCFLLEVDDAVWSVVAVALPSSRIIGQTVAAKAIVGYAGDHSRQLFSLALSELKTAWQEPLREVFQ
ncbi:MAG: AIR synthase-related protein [Patescibacteria group bacterium]|nr:AIR synthase-related protein [Patescibacteria group bacterium]